MLYEVIGDVFKHEKRDDNFVFIPHCVNSIGKWGSGFVVSINKNLNLIPKQCYLDWFINNVEKTNYDCHIMIESMPFALGEIQIVQPDLEKDLAIVNMVGQVGVGQREDGSPPIDYDSIRKAAQKLHNFIIGYKKKSEIACPKFGAGLAAGKWEIIKDIIVEEWVNKGIDVTVYDFPINKIDLLNLL